MILQPLGTRLLVSRKEIKTSGGIIIPETSREKQVSIGEVVSAGDDCTWVTKGDIITFGKYAPHMIDRKELSLYGVTLDHENNAELLLLNEEDALCVILEKEADNG